MTIRKHWPSQICFMSDYFFSSLKNDLRCQREKTVDQLQGILAALDFFLFSSFSFLSATDCLGVLGVISSPRCKVSLIILEVRTGQSVC